MRKVLSSCALTLAVVSVPAAACTPAPGYHVPTNLELAADAQTIVLAKVVAGALDPGGDPFASAITLHPLETLKGSLPAGDLPLYGMMLSRDADPELGMVSDPHEFERAHPVSYIGACVRFIFPLDTVALFFLRQDGAGRWVPAGGAFSRWAEDVPQEVPGPDAPWVALARLYARAAALPADERKALLESERSTLLQRADDRDAQLMAADVARQLAGSHEADAYALLSDETPGQVEDRIEAEVRRTRRAAIEAGN